LQTCLFSKKIRVPTDEANNVLAEILKEIAMHFRSRSYNYNGTVQR